MIITILGSVIILLLIANIIMSVKNLLKDMDSTRIVFGFLTNVVAIPCVIALTTLGASFLDFL